jgi:hypothetical protein
MWRLVLIQSKKALDLLNQRAPRGGHYTPDEKA